VSIKGRDYRWFRDALARGDLALVKATAAQLSAVDLATALEITLLIASEEPHNAERAAVRWLGRWALESRQATLDRAEGWPRHLSGVYRSDRADRS